MQDFVNASDCYEQLVQLHPEVDEYRLYYAQSLYKACLYEEAMKISCQIDNPTCYAKVGALRMIMSNSFISFASFAALTLADNCETES